jgi:hypothetical protein
MEPMMKDQQDPQGEPDGGAPGEGPGPQDAAPSQANAGAPAPEPVVEVVDPHEELKKKLAAAEARLRAVSKAYTDLEQDMDAFRRRMTHQADQRVERKTGEVVESFFEPIRNLKRSIEAGDADPASLLPTRMVFELARRGHEVTVVNSHEAPLPDGARRIHCDRTQPGALTEALANHRDDFDVIFDHTAYRPADMAPLIELFRGRVQHYVFTSSQAVYRRSFVQPFREDSARHAPDNADPRAAYGVGKVQCEDHLLGLWEREGRTPSRADPRGPGRWPGSAPPRSARSAPSSCPTAVLPRSPRRDFGAAWAPPRPRRRPLPPRPWCCPKGSEHAE